MLLDFLHGISVPLFLVSVFHVQTVGVVLLARAVAVEHSFRVDRLQDIPLFAEVLTGEDFVSNVTDEQVGHQSHHHGEGSEREELALALIIDFVSKVGGFVIVGIFDCGWEMDQWFAAQNSEDQADSVSRDCSIEIGPGNVGNHDQLRKDNDENQIRAEFEETVD